MRRVDCLRDDELDATLAAASGDPRRTHARSCPRCAARLDAYRSFLAEEGERDAPHVTVAMTRLSAVLDETIRPPRRGRIDGDRLADAPARPASPAPARDGGPKSWRDWLFGPGRRPVWAMAAVVVAAGAVLWSTRPRDDAPVMRGDPGAAPAVRVEPARQEGDAVVLRWTRWPEADGYRVTLLAADLLERDRLAVTDTTLRLERERLASRGATLYQVEVLVGGDVVATSAPDALLPLP